MVTVPVYYDSELYHHGILGMKWGVRRYQKYGEGGYTPKDKRVPGKVKRNYDYKQSDSYKKSIPGHKSLQTNEYNVNKRLLGKKGANKLEYKVREEGRDRKKERTKAIAKRAISGVAIGTLLATAPSMIKRGKTFFDIGNSAADLYGAQQGLNTVRKKGFTFGSKTMKNGKKFVNGVLGGKDVPMW